jgi:anti-sigma regulatory factor (Ser/Thr protein kinase)
MKQDAPGGADRLIVAANFIQAARDAGYLGLSAALAELIDNSIQAGSRNITVSIDRDGEGVAIEVADDGYGMSRAELADCLRFGGSSRFNCRQALGRYGMGLPGSSISVARRVDVISKTQSAGTHSVYLDLDEVARGDLDGLTPRRRRVGLLDGEGTVVRWSRCDRVTYQRLGWAERSIMRDLGRIFRKFLDDVHLCVNGKPVPPIDPLFLMTELEGTHAQAACAPLVYQLDVGHGATEVRVAFSELPVRAWHHMDNKTKRSAGVIGGAGVSILRAGREIARGWHFMGGKRQENYDDWWRCEISFDPAADEAFGITHTKQGIRPTPELKATLEPDLEGIARSLNHRVREEFEAIRFEREATRSCEIAARADARLPVLSKGRRRSRCSVNRRYLISTGPRPSAELFSYEYSRDTFKIMINTEHSAFNALYEPLRALSGGPGDNLRTATELLVIALARSQAVVESGHAAWSDYPALWSQALAAMLSTT